MSTQQTAIATLKNELPNFTELVRVANPNVKHLEAVVLTEIANLETMSISKQELLQCDIRSIDSAIRFVLKNNLTLDPNAGLVYTKTRNVKVGQAWAKVIEVQPTCEGLLSIAYQCGKILDHDRPEVTKDANGKVIGVSFRYLKPSFGQPRWVEITFDESDFKKWRSASHKENGRGKEDGNTKDYSNPNYSSFNGGIDPEFARAKAIRHSLKKLGTNPNERFAAPVSKPMERTVDVSMDMEASQEEFSEHEEIASVPVQIFDDVKIPSEL
jgi:hypothetical protein